MTSREHLWIYVLAIIIFQLALWRSRTDPENTSNTKAANIRNIVWSALASIVAFIVALVADAYGLDVLNTLKATFVTLFAIEHTSGLHTLLGVLVDRLNKPEDTS